MVRPIISFTKKILPLEPRRSKLITDAHLKLLRNAIVVASAVSEFYYEYIEREKEEGRPSNIMPRDATQILGQMKNQKLFVCEQVNLPIRDHHDIVAASILWEHELPVPSDSGYFGYDCERFLEIGTQVSVLGGFSFQWILTAVTLIEQLSFDPTGVLFAATYGNNLRVAESFVRTMKFATWDDLPPTLHSMRLHHLDEGGPEEAARGVKWFRPTIQTVFDAAALLVDLDSNPIRKSRKSQYSNNEPQVSEIEFIFDKAEFRQVTFEEMLEFCRRIIKLRPKTLAELKAAAENRAIDEQFVYWPSSG